MSEVEAYAGSTPPSRVRRRTLRSIPPPVSGPIPLHRYRAFKRGKVDERAERIRGHWPTNWGLSSAALAGDDVRLGRLAGNLAAGRLDMLIWPRQSGCRIHFYVKSSQRRKACLQLDIIQHETRYGVTRRWRVASALTLEAEIGNKCSGENRLVHGRASTVSKHRSNLESIIYSNKKTDDTFYF